jgi:hypothetical protein
MKLLSPVTGSTSRDNSYGTVETNVQRSFSINVWCNTVADMSTGPLILDDRMTGHNYLDFLQYGLPEKLEDVTLASWIAMYYQHDGAPSHCTRLVMQHLSDTFPNQRIGRGSTINWPRSPNLTLLDFCLWGWMKSKVYRRKVDTRADLFDHIMNVIARIKEHQDALRRRATHHVLT